ncbi:ABC transporter permease [Pedobacter caeni]|uniref:ABC-type antimicrobial peptide transport system, permease component n=1 Tax=Pedobacter caeni TaxID=288992 RepID=A0A1M5ALT1_9SPHI|nr:ABC transporter permease [Pedobacter caeni]SHF31183.1 ABC-type antimicrobial peptide transport system, permease component [Pedobacter caeni]
MFRLNLKIALRNLWKNKGYTLINVGGLAIGLASCMLLLLYVAHEWSYNRQFSNYDKTYVVFNNTKTPNEILSWPWTPPAMAKEVGQQIAGVSRASCSTNPAPLLIANGEKSFRKQAVFADQEFLKILDYKFLKGNPEKALQAVNGIILTESTAKSLFGNEDPINKTLKLENSQLLKVEAVIADLPETNSIQFDYLMPWAAYEKQFPWFKDAGWGSHFVLTLVQLEDNSFFNQVSAEMKGIFKRHEKGSLAEAIIHPFSKWHLYSRFENGKSVGGRIDQVKIFVGIAFCILLIACVNFMNLSTARSQKRAKEVGVRKAIGSSRKSLINQFLVESVLLSFIAMLLAFVLMEITLPYFNRLLHIELVLDYGNWKFWTVLCSLTLFTGFIAGSYPAFYLSSFEPVKVLKGFNLVGTSSVSIRKVLVVAQFVFAVCLIICTIIVYQQLNYVKNKSIGYEKAGLIEIPLQGNLGKKGGLGNKESMNVLKDELIKSGVVSSVTYFSSGMNWDGHRTFDMNWPGKSKKELVYFNYRCAGLDFVKTIGGKLSLGREFSPKHHDSLNVMVNESAIKVMGLKDPIGKVISMGKDQVTIIGVIKDIVVGSPYQQAAPMVIFDWTVNLNFALVRLNPGGNISSAVQKIDEVTKRLNPDFPVERNFVDDEFKLKFQNEQLLGTLANWFGGFAVFISCLGLLGLTLYMAEQRKKEISIRKVLGAGAMDVLSLLNKDFMKLVGIANLIGFPLAYIIMTRWLSAYEFRVGISIWPFATAMGLSLLIAILTLSIQSAKVLKSNPVDGLKYE